MKRRLALLVALAMVVSVAGFAMAGSFEDTQGHAFEGAIEEMAGLGVLEGYGDGVFGPDDILNRAQAAKVASLLMGLTEEDADAAADEDHFTDVGEDMPGNVLWARGWINLMAQDEVIVGLGGGLFGPAETLTISHWATMLVRILGYETEEMMANWPAAYDELAIELGLGEGIDYEGSRQITRGEMAKMTNNALDVEMVVGGTIRDLVFPEIETEEEDEDEDEDEEKDEELEEEEEEEDEGEQEE